MLNTVSTSVITPSPRNKVKNFVTLYSIQAFTVSFCTEAPLRVTFTIHDSMVF